MKRKIVADSSANLLTLDGIDFQSCPLVIRTNEREFVDDENLDVAEMADYLKSYKGKSGSACPGVGDYLAALIGDKFGLINKNDENIIKFKYNWSINPNSNFF